jgi:hypothetical protein
MDAVVIHPIQEAPMLRIPGSVAVLTGVFAVVRAACSTDAPLPTAADTLSSASHSAGLPAAIAKRYGFRMLEREQAVAMVDGTKGRKCSDYDTGHAIYQLTLTEKIIDELRSVLSSGGTAEIEIYSVYTLVGDGQYQYSQIAQIGSPAGFSDDSHNRAETNPGWPGLSMDVVFRKNLTQADAAAAVAGNHITVSMAGRAMAMLIGPQCGDIKGGQSTWRARGAVLDLRS